MFKSIIDDIKQNFAIGNMVMKLIIVNVLIFAVAALLIAFGALYPFSEFIYNNFSISADPGKFLYKPWTLITNMFLHTGLFHILWNMVGLNLFGRIVGDLLGDKRVLPLYIFGGLVAGLTFIVSSQIRGMELAYALGASGSIMAFAMTAGLIAPNYLVRLLLIGDVKIKYIVLAFLFFDIIGSQGMENSGGHYAHLGGMLAGFLFIFLYKKGFDILMPFDSFFNLLSKGNESIKPVTRAKMKVEHRSETLVSQQQKKMKMPLSEEFSFQERLDHILDKINIKGYNKLSEEEKIFLREASKKK
jgi:membrane associated rhomboid family serine protease